MSDDVLTVGRWEEGVSQYFLTSLDGGKVFVRVEHGRIYVHGEASETTDAERIGEAMKAWARAVSPPPIGEGK